MHCADPNWVKGDWYLGLPGEYRILFNALTGHDRLGTAWAIPLLRALPYRLWLGDQLLAAFGSTGSISPFVGTFLPL